MDGLNETWEKYGCNMYDVVVTQACCLPGNIQYWVDKYGAKYTCFTVESSSAICDALGTTSSGPVYVIYPDRTFIKTLPPHFANAQPPYYFELIEQAGAQPNLCDSTKINNNKFLKIYSGNVIIHNLKIISVELLLNSNVNLSITDIKGRTIYTFMNGRKSKGKYNFNYNFNKLPAGLYLINFRINNTYIMKKVFVD